MPIPLPPKASAKLARIKSRVNDAYALLNSLTESVKIAETRVHNAQHNITTGDPRDARGYARLLYALEAAEAERVEVERQRSTRQAAVTAAEAPLLPLTQWLETTMYGPIGSQDDWDDVVVDVATIMDAGEDYASAIARIRGQIQTAQHEINRLEHAPLPLAEVKARIIAQVKEMGQPPGLKLDDPVFGPMVRIRWPGDAANHEWTNLHGWRAVCWLHGDAIAAALCAQAELAIGASGMPLADRQPRIYALTMQMQRWEYEEEALIVAAENEGVALIPRRGDASPMAVLGIVRPQPEPQQVAAE